MSIEDLSGWVPVTIDGETVGRASIEYGVATVQLRPETGHLFRAGLVGGLSLTPDAAGGLDVSAVGPVAGGPSSSGRCDGSAACPAAVHLEGCYRHLPLLDLPGSDRLERNRARGVDLRGNPRRSAEVEGVEVSALMCEATGHEEVPAVAVGEFRRPWGFGLAEVGRVAYCGPCSRIAQDSGLFTPDAEAGK